MGKSVMDGVSPASQIVFLEAKVAKLEAQLAAVATELDADHDGCTCGWCGVVDEGTENCLWCILQAILEKDDENIITHRHLD